MSTSKKDKTPQKKQFNGELLDKEEVVAKVLTLVKHEMKVHSGPIPDPESFQKYEKVCPGSAERILSMAEKNGEHRRKCEETELKANINLNKASFWSFLIGKILGTLVTILCGIGAFILTWYEKSEVIAGILFGTPLVTIIGFIVKSYSDKESNNKNNKDKK